MNNLNSPRNINLFYYTTFCLSRIQVKELTKADAPARQPDGIEPRAQRHTSREVRQFWPGLLLAVTEVAPTKSFCFYD